MCSMYLGTTAWGHLTAVGSRWWSWWFNLYGFMFVKAKYNEQLIYPFIQHAIIGCLLCDLLCSRAKTPTKNKHSSWTWGCTPEILEREEENDKFSSTFNHRSRWLAWAIGDLISEKKQKQQNPPKNHTPLQTKIQALMELIFS